MTHRGDRFDVNRSPPSEDAIRRGRSGRGSSPCPTPPRSHARTCPWRPRRRRPPPGARSWEFEPKTRSTAVAVHLTSSLPCRRPSYTFSAAADVFHSVPISSRLTKKSFVNVLRPVGEDAVPGLAMVGVEGPQATDEHRHLGSGQRQHVRPLHQQRLRRQLLSGLEVVAEAVRGRFEHGERLDVGLLLRGVRAPRRERDGDVVTGVLRRLLDGRAPTEHDQVGERDLLPTGLRAVEVLLDLLESLQHRGQFAGIVDLPAALWFEADPGAVRPAPLVGTAEARRRRPRGGDQLGDREPGSEDLLLERGDVLVADQLDDRPPGPGPATTGPRAPTGRGTA